VLVGDGLTSNGVGEVAIIGPDEESVSINQPFQKPKATIGIDSQAILVTERPQQVKNAVCSASKPRDLLGYHHAHFGYPIGPHRQLHPDSRAA